MENQSMKEKIKTIHTGYTQYLEERRSGDE
jgi:hypothetical protein